MSADIPMQYDHNSRNLDRRAPVSDGSLEAVFLCHLSGDYIRKCGDHVVQVLHTPCPVAKHDSRASALADALEDLESE